MPCNTITTQSVALAKALPDLLRAALVTDGWTILSASSTGIRAHNANYDYVTWTAGKGLEVRSSNPQEQITRVTQAYSRQAVSWAAQRAGWTVKQDAPNTLTITRR